MGHTLKIGPRFLKKKCGPYTLLYGIVAGFRKAGFILCAADGDVGESDSNESEDNSDVPAVLRPEVTALFVSDSEKDDFDGFDLNATSYQNIKNTSESILKFLCTLASTRMCVCWKRAEHIKMPGYGPALLRFLPSA